ncbi:MAG: peptidase M15 [Desulfotalea sp.]|nr:MAG: peptidase M15 [Desulfotalea sp.]
MQEQLEEKPIPRNVEDTWEEVYSTPIVNCEEDVVPLSLAPEQILVRSRYYEAGIAGALPECHARRGAFKLLLKAATLLPDHLRLVVLDAWRSQQVQTILFQQCNEALTKVYPEADKDTLHVMTQQYVARPSLDPGAPSPHSTGGAIDLIIATRDGLPLSFGSPFDDPNEISCTRHFEEKLEQGIILTESEEDALKNRRLLYHIMTAAGFVNFPCEWWHFEYGTQRWAKNIGRDSAIYGATTVCLNAFNLFEKSDQHTLGINS